MGGQSSGYQSQPMNQWGGGQRFGGGGFGGGFGGYGNGGYMPQSFNQQGYGQPQGFGWNNNFSNGFGGWNQFGGWPQFNRQFQGGYAGGNMSQGNSAGIGQDAPYQPPSMYQNPMNLGAMTGGNMGAGNVAGPGLGGGGQQIVRQLQFSPASQDMNQDMVPTRTQGMVRLPPINYDQYQKQPNQYEYLNGGNSPFSQVA